MSNSSQSALIKARVSALPEVGFVRLASIIAPHGPLPISRSTWFQWRREGRAPAPIQLSPRITAYRVEDIHQLLASFEVGGAK